MQHACMPERHLGAGRVTKSSVWIGRYVSRLLAQSGECSGQLMDSVG